MNQNVITTPRYKPPILFYFIFKRNKQKKIKKIFSLVIFFIICLELFLNIGILIKPVIAQNKISQIINSCLDKKLSYENIVVDNINIDICMPISFGNHFVQPQQNDSDQSAYIANYNPYKQLIITSIPFGLTSSKDFPISSKDNLDQYKNLIKKNKQVLNDNNISDISINVFNTNVKSDIGIRKINIDSNVLKDVITLDWTLEFGNRIWTISYTREIEENRSLKDLYDELKQLNKLQITSENANKDSLILNKIKLTNNNLSNKQNIILASINTNTTYPSWWNGKECDKGRYSQSYRLTNSSGYGISLYGVFPCGPGGTSTNYGTVAYYTSPNGTQEEEWQCVELSHRFIYMVYGDPFYSANGKDIVNNYNGSTLQKVYAGTNIGLKQGDILALGATSTNPYGHTSIITESYIDNNGTGKVVTMEENNNLDGRREIQFTNFRSNDGRVTGWLTPKSNTPSSPTYPQITDSSLTYTVKNAAGSLEVFTRGYDRAIYHKWQYPGGWSGWENLGGIALDNPVVGKNADGRLEVFVKGGDNAYYHKYQLSGGGWSAWINMGGNWPGDPNVILNPLGGLEVFARGNDGHIYHAWQYSGNSWTGWESLKTDNYFNSDPYAVINKANSLEVFAKRDNGDLYHIWNSPSGWSWWENIGGYIINKPIVNKIADGRIEVFAKGGDNAYWHKWQLTQGGWSNWDYMGGDWKGDPFVLKNSNGNLEVFAKGNNSLIYHNLYTPSGWTGWLSLNYENKNMISDPFVILNAANSAEVFTWSSDGNAYHKWNSPSGYSWWDNLYRP